MRAALSRLLRVVLVTMLLATSTIAAQEPSSSSQASAKSFKPEELEQIVAPIALYPDGVVAQVLMASTYPIEVIDAAQFAKSNANLKGDALNEAREGARTDDHIDGDRDEGVQS